MQFMSTYRHIEIEDSVGEPTAVELAAIEETLGAQLPTDFADFLKVANGGYSPYSIDVPIDDEGNIEILCFCEIYGTRKQNGNEIEEGTFLDEISTERRYKNIPSQILPIARDGGSSILYLDLTTQGAGRVVAFVERLPEWTGMDQNNTFIELAKNFGEYVDKLYLEPDETN